MTAKQWIESHGGRWNRTQALMDLVDWARFSRLVVEYNARAK